MDPFTLLLGALSLGAIEAVKETASQAVKDTYAGLKTAIQNRFADDPKAEMVLTEYEKDAETWVKPLQKHLTEYGLVEDEEVMHRAQQVMNLVQPHQLFQGKFNIQAREMHGTVIGDNANVQQHFGRE